MSPPPLRNREDTDYEFFVEGLRNFAGSVLSQPASQALNTALGVSPAPLPQIDRAHLRAVGDPVPVLATRNRLLRSSQQMMWRRLVESYGASRAEIEAGVIAAQSSGPGSLELRADFVVPEYARAVFHQQPGGYQGDVLTGHVYHYGTKVFFTGTNDHDELHESLADLVVPPQDGRVRRVLEIGCSIGQCATALKRRFPDSEVTAIDVSMPLLRYAHFRAVQRQQEVHFKQRNAEDSGFPSDEFDAALSVIVFHEVPFAVTQRIVREMFRVLRPGGTFTIFDFPSGGVLPASLQYFLDIDAQYNGEPWSLEFIYADFTRALRDAGFGVVEGPNAARYLRSWVCTKPVR